MRNLIGLGLTMLGVVLAALTEYAVFYVVMFVGVFLFVSFPAEDLFYDYRIVNTEVALLRKRHYFHFLPLTIVSTVLTLGKGVLLIPWKEEYFTKDVEGEEPITVPVSRKEYIALRNAQRKIYTTQVLPREFMEESYTPELIGFKRKKARLIVACVLAVLMLTMLAEPEGLVLVLIYEAVFLPMVILWIPAYKDAKILQEAYDKAAMTPYANIPQR